MNKISLSTLKINRYQIQVLSFALFLSWLILFSACGVQSEINPTDMPPTAIQGTEMVQASINNTPTATKQLATSEPTSTPTALATLPPSLTPTETVPPSPTPIPTETVTPSPTPTLSAEEIQQRWQMIDAQIEAIMDSNNGCQLPCWWGIEPGDSVADARQIFNTINENGWVDSPAQWGELQQVGFFEHRYRNKREEYLSSYFVVNLVTQTDQVHVIHIFIQPHTNSHPTLEQYNDVNDLLSRDWEQFSAQNMFEAFGEPDLIYLLPQGFADGDNLSYLFNLYYPTLGMVVSYSSPLLFDNNGERTMCLNMFDMDSMDLVLYDPAVELPAGYVQANYRLWPLSSELKPEDISLVEGNDLQSLTGMSIDEFVTFVLQNGNDTDCFAVN